MEITKRLRETAYSILWEQKPESVIDISLAQVGFWLKIKIPISQFFAEAFIEEIERRRAGINWAHFDEGIGKPDWTPIKSVWKLPIGNEIVKYLKSHESDYTHIPTDPVQVLHDAMLSHELQKKICGWISERELRRIADEMTALSGHDDVLLRKRREFLQSCQSLLNDWFAGTNLPIPQFDKNGSSPGSISPLSRWEDLTVTFRSHDSVQIRITGQKPRILTYVDLGFKDGRKGDRPNKLWGLLKGIAAYSGSLQPDNPLLDLKSRKTTEKQIGRIRKTLKTYFSLDENPIKWKRYDGYRCIFTLKAADHLIDQWREDYSPQEDAYPKI